MILEELCAYYERQRLRPESQMGTYGFQYRRLDFLIEVAPDGSFLRLLPTRNLSAHEQESFLLPMERKRARQIAPNLFWDQASYVLGISEGEESADPASPKRKAFAELIDLAARENPAHEGLFALQQFYQQGHWAAAAGVFAMAAKRFRHPTLSFRLAGESKLIAEDASLQTWIRQRLDDEEGPEIQCLVTGRNDKLAVLHPSIKGLKGALGTGATLVSFQQESSRFFGKKQGENAPIGRQAAYAYTSALNHLLKPGSERVVHFNDLSLIFWTEEGEDWDQGFAQFLTLHAGQAAYQAFFEELQKGRWAQDTRAFYVLALSVQKTRIAVRYWQKFILQELQMRLREFFSDLRLIHAPYEAQTLSLYALAGAMAEEERSEVVESNRMLELFTAIASGKMYPQTWFCINMGLIRKEKKISYQRAAIIKAYLVRWAKFNQVQEEVGVALDSESTNIAYTLGRLFAVLERLQEEANQHSSNLRDRYYTTASTSPAAVFPQILRQKNMQLSRIPNKTLRDRFERDIAQLFLSIDHIPSSLSLTDQGRFVIGYYHQRQEYFTPRRPREQEQSG